ncbi:MAG: DUF5777 family beta-barrel protein [Salinivirgaceae bacterium]|jgi:hypothetical protein|nr:DUF5777 family beta-barrel protein [Salinivirgaceae bacterium]
MKRIILPILTVLIFVATTFAQEEEVKKKDKPVSEPFFAGYLMDAQTTHIQNVKTIGMSIHHKFGTIENGRSDVWGVYSSANIRLAVDYVVYENLQIGYGLTKTDLTHDLNVKYTIFEQTRKNTMPVALGVYGNMGISGNPDLSFGEEYKFTDRMSYFGQVIVGRKFTNRITVQTGVSFTHFNHADTTKFDFDRIGLHLNGRVKLTGTGAFIFNVDYPLKALQLENHSDIELKPNVTFGWEIATATHAFQIHMGYSKEILPQYYMMREGKEFEFEQFNIGFVITRMWN